MVIKFKNKKVIVLNMDANIIKLTKDEYTTIDERKKDDIVQIDGRFVDKIIAYGEVESDDISLFQIVKHYIPSQLIKGKTKKEDVHSFKCFAGRTGKNSNVIIHEDIGSSYNCLISVLNNPQYVLVYK